MSQTTPPSLWPDPPREPGYVQRMRHRLHAEIEARRQTERENLKLRTELARLVQKMARHSSAKDRKI